uniref:Putative CP n=1 Tax=Scutellospora partitivirus A TaxID=2592706 RepID=A0A7G3KIN1_9VIRU|nr:putative CP [Scutellospora partitivirus A]
MMGLNVTDGTRIGNFFGQLLDDGTNRHSYAHQLMQAFEGIINPALARSRSQRNVYSRVPHHVQPSQVDVNPYQLMMNADEDNVSETMTLMRQIQATISSKFKISGKLSTVAASLTGMNITIHGYSNFAIPTWHNTAVPQNTDASGTVTAKRYAELLRFLHRPTRTGNTDLPYPDDATTISTILYLVQDRNLTDAYPTNAKLVSITGRNNSVPPVRIMDPYDYNATTFHNAYLSGALIESLELDGSAVPLPNMENVLDEENTLFLQSAIPFSDIHRATNFVYTTTAGVYAEQRVPIGPHGQPSALMLYDLTQNRLPHFDKRVQGAVPTALPGFDIVPHMSLWTSIYSKIGFRVPNSDEKTRNRPNIPEKGSFLVWSPYRYYNGKIMTSDPENYFMITNLRTIFGTNVPLGETAHFLEVMPI